MSLKRDRFTSADKKYMKLAINLAYNQQGLTGPNPSVGCVVVKNKKILSYGSTNIFGRPHAEINALKKKNNYSRSTVYVTLEPCSHYGKTPPCTNALISSRIKKLIYSIDDLDYRTYKKSKKILSKKKILIKSGLFKNKVKILYNSYNYTKIHHTPYITGKIACSKNYYILKNNTNITNNHSRKVTHLLRSKNQAILTSYKTINIDNPKLNCRINGLEKFSPIKIIIDRDLKINLNSQIIKKSEKKKTIIFHNSKNTRKINYILKKGHKPIYFDVEKDNYFDLKKIFRKIYDLGIYSVLVECGSELTYKMISKRIFNEFYFFKSNKVIKNIKKINILNSNLKLNKIFKNKIKVDTYLDKDNLYHYY